MVTHGRPAGAEARRRGAQAGLRAALSVALASAFASAQQEPASGFVPRLDLDPGRARVAPGEEGLLRLQIHGEYQLRGFLQSDVPLEPPPGDPASGSLGREGGVYHWLRMTPRFQVSDWLELVAQADVMRGLLLGETTRRVEAAAYPDDRRDPFQIAGRWLYAEARGRAGLVRVGQQPSHLGMGVLANDGDHPPLFGDYRGGDISERVLVATKPFGRSSALALFAAGDLVFRDAYARLADGDRALQGLFGLRVGDDEAQIGAFGLVRRQRRDREATGPRSPFTERLDVTAIDVNGRLAAPLPGTPAYLVGEAEAVLLAGSTTAVRTAEQAPAGESEKIRAWAGAARLALVHEASGEGGRWGDWVASFGWGWATGDAAPDDGTSRRFVMNPNFKVGLVLFDQVLAWKSARAASLAADPALVARAAPGSQLLPTNGGVAGAAYVNPTVVARPKRWLDLKAGLVVAQSTADVVDPYQLTARGKARNWDGGDPRAHDLGLELDGGVEVRVPLEHDLSVQLGLQAGVLFPGHAFDDSEGNQLPAQHLEVLRAGLQY